MIEIVLLVLTAVIIAGGVYIKKIKDELEDKIDLIVQLQSIDAYEYDEVKENFLKFVSDSREWAFDYIENVQVQILQTIQLLDEPINNIYNKKRKSSDEKILLEAYKNLKNLLPEQGN